MRVVVCFREVSCGLRIKEGVDNLVLFARVSMVWHYVRRDLLPFARLQGLYTTEIHSSHSRSYLSFCTSYVSCITLSTTLQHVWIQLFNPKTRASMPALPVSSYMLTGTRRNGSRIKEMI